MGRKAKEPVIDGVVQPVEKVWLTRKEAMEYCHLGKDSFRKYVDNTHCVVTSLVGKRRRYLKSSLDDYIRSNYQVTPKTAERWQMISGML